MLRMGRSDPTRGLGRLVCVSRDSAQAAPQTAPREGGARPGLLSAQAGNWRRRAVEGRNGGYSIHRVFAAFSPRRHELRCSFGAGSCRPVTLGTRFKAASAAFRTHPGSTMSVNQEINLRRRRRPSLRSPPAERSGVEAPSSGCGGEGVRPEGPEAPAAWGEHQLGRKGWRFSRVWTLDPAAPPRRRPRGFLFLIGPHVTWDPKESCPVREKSKTPLRVTLRGSCPEPRRGRAAEEGSCVCFCPLQGGCVPPAPVSVTDAASGRERLLARQPAPQSSPARWRR